MSTGSSGLLSWKMTGTICASASLAILLGREIEPFGGVAAVAGFSAGLLGSVFSTPVATARTLVLVASCILICTLIPAQWTAFLCGFVLVSWAAFDARISGSLATVPALNGLLLYLLIPPDQRTASLVAMFVIAAAVGGVVSTWLRLLGSARRKPMSVKGAVSIWIFLILGLGLTSILAQMIGNQKSYWLSFLFVFRVLAPLEKVPDSALRFGIGVAIGSLVAICLESVGLPHRVLMLLGIASAIVGVHRIGGRTMWTAMFFTIATLLITAPTVEFAVFRIEAAAMVVVLVGGLAFLISWIWERIENRIGV